MRIGQKLWIFYWRPIFECVPFFFVSDFILLKSFIARIPTLNHNSVKLHQPKILWFFRKRQIKVKSLSSSAKICAKIDPCKFHTFICLGGPRDCWPKFATGSKIDHWQKIYNSSPIFMKLCHYCLLLRWSDWPTFIELWWKMHIFLLLVIFKPSRKFSSTVSILS